jgi:Tfp pilus assembly protein PilO
MKLKILVAPVLIAIIMIMAIWYVYPAFQDLRSKQDALSSAQSKLVDIQNKNSNAEALKASLGGGSLQSETVTRYIPEQRKEEEIIGALNSLANSIGLVVYKISITNSAISAPVNNAPAVSNQAVVFDPNNPNGNTSQSSVADTQTAVVAPAMNNFTVNLGVTGGYGKIKDIMSKIAALQRFNSVSSLVISKAQVVGVVDDSTNDNLQADINLKFNYLAKSGMVSDSDSAIFSNDSLDMSVVDDINNKMSTVVRSLTVDAHGTTNPFVK